MIGTNLLRQTGRVVFKTPECRSPTTAHKWFTAKDRTISRAGERRPKLVLDIRSLKPRKLSFGSPSIQNPMVPNFVEYYPATVVPETAPDNDTEPKMMEMIPLFKNVPDIIIHKPIGTPIRATLNNTNNLEGLLASHLKFKTDVSAGSSINVDTPQRPSLMQSGLDIPNDINILGKGKFGTVIEGCYKGMKAAVKVLPCTRNFIRRSLFNEENALGLHHPNVVQVYKVVHPTEADQGYGLVIMELCTNALTLQTAAKKRFQDEQIYRYVTDVALGLQYIHANQILHLDVKPGNVLFTEGGRCKLCDFGVSVHINSIYQDRWINRGTVGYIAPEILMGHSEAPSTSCDVYSLGILMWFLEYNFEPYSMENGETQDSIIYQVVKYGLRPSTNITSRNDNSTKRKYRQLYQQCWNHFPKERPTIAEILKTLAVLQN